MVSSRHPWSGPNFPRSRHLTPHPLFAPICPRELCDPRRQCCMRRSPLLPLSFAHHNTESIYPLTTNIRGLLDQYEMAINIGRKKQQKKKSQLIELDSPITVSHGGKLARAPRLFAFGSTESRFENQSLVFFSPSVQCLCFGCRFL